MKVPTTRSHFEACTRRNGQLGAIGQPAETLREGEEIAEIIAAAHGLPVVRLPPGDGFLCLRCTECAHRKASCTPNRINARPSAELCGA
jgi:hypothetical protein